ncbi:MAG: TetR/AcrR family transcriptional regulator [Ornithinimicrobium sp.]
MTTRGEQYEQQRNQILTVALNHFTRDGFAGTSLRGVGRELGVSSGLLFHYFATKEALYTELLRIAASRMAMDLDTATGDPVAFLRGQAEGVLTLLAEQPVAARFFLLVDYAQRHPGIDPEADRLLADHQIVEQSIPVLAAGQRMGVVRDGDPHALALAFWASLQGIAQEVAGRDDVPLPQTEWILDLVLTPGGPR